MHEKDTWMPDVILRKGFGRLHYNLAKTFLLLRL